MAVATSKITIVSMKFKTKDIAYIGILIALNIVFTRLLAINTMNMKFGFGFIAAAVAAMLYGPLAAAIVAGLGDFLGSTLFAVGTYFPGFTLTALFTGLIYGFLLHGEASKTKMLLAVLMDQLIISLCINTYFISLLSGSSYMALFSMRIIQAVIMGAVQFACFCLLPRLVNKIKQFTE